ncbi:MAG TPA: hypothetical protein PKA53_02965 [Sphingobacterium sp.]|nr:hypothetical protein [Sphingobacterium sp.]
MKNIWIGIVALGLVCSACTKEELVVIDREIELDENSLEYQDYLVERAIGFIKMYRFEKLKGVRDRIVDPEKKKEVDALYTEYRTIAENNGLYFVTAEKDTLFFLPAHETKPSERTGLGLVFNNAPNMVNSKGALYGFKNFPKVEILSFRYPLTSELHDLEYMPNLKQFGWELVPRDFEERYPNEEFAPTKLKADFSKNSKLETMVLIYASMAELKFPPHKLKQVELRTGGIFNDNDNLNNLHVNHFRASSGITSVRPELTLKNHYIDSLELWTPDLKSIDVSDTKLLTAILSGRDLEKVKLNNTLTKLQIAGTNLLSAAEAPASLEFLNLSSKAFTDKNFSHLTRLKELVVEDGISHDGLSLPANIESITLNRGTITGSSIDYSTFNGLTVFNTRDMSFDKAPAFPSSLSKLNLSGTRLPANATLDLSNLTNLGFLRVHAYNSQPFTLILPDNLTEAAVVAGFGRVNSRGGTIMLPGGSTIVNAPEWLSQYIYIGAL